MPHTRQQGFHGPTAWAAAPFLIGIVLATAQTPPPADSPDVRAFEGSPPYQIRVDANLVVVRVVVRDAQGRPVAHLHKEDFRITDKGKLQEITGFAVETGAPGASPSRAAASPAPNVEPGSPTAPAAPIPQRFVALFFDDLHMEPGAVVQTRDAVLKYISTALQPDDRIAIVTSSSRVAIDFTADRDQLHDALFRISPRPPNTSTHECPAIGDYQAFLIDQRQDRGAIGVAAQEARDCLCPAMRKCPDTTLVAKAQASQVWSQAEKRSQDALNVADAILRRLAVMPGQRSLVLLSTGFLSQTCQRAMEALIDRALHQNIVIHAIDAAGLYTESLYTDTYPGGFRASHTGLDSPKLAIENEGLRVQRDVLADLAAGTGGAFFHGNNDFNEGLRRTAQTPDAYYVLSFSPRDVKRDGQFHPLRVTVQAAGHWDVQARRGYFAEPAITEKPATSDQLESLVYSLDEVRSLPATLTARMEKPVEQMSELNVKIRVDIRDVPFRKEGDRNVNKLTFDTALFDHDGKYVTGKESVLDFHATNARLDALRQSGVNAQISFRVMPGAYRIREIVREAESKKLAALNSNVEMIVPPVQAVPARHKDAKIVKTMAEWTTAEFLRAMPELKGLEAIENQERLTAVLEGASKNVESFFDQLPDTTARERIDLEDPGAHRKEEFNYLALHPPGGSVAIEEYRTDAAGKRVEPEPLEFGFVTKGAVSMVSYFHPLYLSDSVFRYLGRQNVDGHALEVVCFTQIPGKARVTQSLKSGNRSLTITVQGVAWIDSESYHIVRMRTELLEPHVDPELQRETTESRFTEVRFKDAPESFWLPADVIVTLKWRDREFRNRHRYSQFHLFRTDVTVDH